MSLLDKLMFWKKHDGFDLGDMPDLGGPETGDAMGKHGPGYGGHEDAFGNDGFRRGDGFSQQQGMGADNGFAQQGFGGNDFGSMQQNSFSSQMQRPFSQQFNAGMPNSPQNQFGELVNKDMEIISSKLDSLKAGIDVINQRLANLERTAGAQQGSRRRDDWY